MEMSAGVHDTMHAMLSFQESADDANRMETYIVVDPHGSR